MRPALAAMVLLTCPACGEVQDAEPLAKTVPIGLLTVSLTFAVVGVATVRTVRRAGRVDGGLRFPRVTAALVLAPTALLGGALTAFIAGIGAFAYREAHVDVFSWADMVSFAAIVGAVTAITHGLAALITIGITSASRRARNTALVVLWSLVVGLTFAAGGAGLLWLPAAMASHWVERATPGTGVSAGRSGPVRPDARLPVGSPRG